MEAIPALGRIEFEASLVCIARLYLKRTKQNKNRMDLLIL
jgi:hypothetical protein